jgi:hypothetical protein
MAQFLIPSGSKRISQLTSVSGISGSTAIPIVMGGDTVQVSHTDFLDSTVFNKQNTFTHPNTFYGNQTITGSLNVTGSLEVNNDVKIQNGYVILSQVSQSLEFEDDAAAELGNVPLGGLYRSGSFIKIRIS